MLVYEGGFDGGILVYDGGFETGILGNDGGDCLVYTGGCPHRSEDCVGFGS